MERRSVLSLVEAAPNQTQEYDQPHKSVTTELPGAVLGVVDVEGLDLVREVSGHSGDREIVRPRLSGAPAAVHQAARHQRGEARETDRSLVSELDGRRLDSQYDVIILVLSNDNN